MTKEEIINVVKNIRNYMVSGNPIWDKDTVYEALSTAIEALERTPNAHPTHESVKPTHECVEPVGNSDTLRGKWIVNRYDSRGVCCCSNCFEQFVHVPLDGEGVPWNYCPNCGARMKGADDE